MDEIQRFLFGWQRVRNNVLQAAQDMPEQFYGYALFEETRTFHEQIQHILHNADVFVDCTLNGHFNLALFDLYPYKGLAKDALLTALAENLSAHSGKLAAQGPAISAGMITYLDGSERPALEILRGMKEHEIAHLNQMYFYLRGKAITPHSTRERQKKSGH